MKDITIMKFKRKNTLFWIFVIFLSIASVIPGANFDLSNTLAGVLGITIVFGVMYFYQKGRPPFCEINEVGNQLILRPDDESEIKILLDEINSLIFRNEFLEINTKDSELKLKYASCFNEKQKDLIILYLKNRK